MQKIVKTCPNGRDIISQKSPKWIYLAQLLWIIPIWAERYGVSAAACQSFDRVPCLVIRSLCDYADGEKNDTWHEYAAAAAAGFVKYFLLDEPLEPRGE